MGGDTGEGLKYLVDPKIPTMRTIPNLECIEAKASEGVPKLVERLIGK